MWIALALVAPALTGAFLVGNCVAMWRAEGRSGLTVASGVVGAVTLAATAAGAWLSLAGSPSAVRLALAALPLIVLAWGFVVWVAISNLYVRCSSRRAHPAEAVIVLGGRLNGGRRVSRLLARRVELGLVLARERWSLGKDVPLIMSGGQGDDELVSEAQAMMEYAVELGADAARLVPEDRSTTTEENLAYSAEVLRGLGITGPVLVASNDFHAFRAKLMMRRAGVPGHAVGFATRRHYWGAATIREFLAWLHDHRVVGAVVLLACWLPLVWSLV